MSFTTKKTKNMLSYLFTLSIGIFIGLLIKNKVASKNIKDAHEILNRVEVSINSINSSKVMEQLMLSSEFILITKNKSNEYYFSAMCQKEMVKGYCPPIYSFYENTDSAVDEILRIINKNKPPL